MRGKTNPAATDRKVELFLMTGANVQHTKEHSQERVAPPTDKYDLILRGRFPVGVRTVQALDTARDRLFPCEIWYPAAAQPAYQDVAPATQDFFKATGGCLRDGSWWRDSGRFGEGSKGQRRGSRKGPFSEQPAPQTLLASQAYARLALFFVRLLREGHAVKKS